MGSDKMNTLNRLYQELSYFEQDIRTVEATISDLRSQWMKDNACSQLLTMADLNFEREQMTIEVERIKEKIQQLREELGLCPAAMRFTANYMKANGKPGF